MEGRQGPQLKFLATPLGHSLCLLCVGAAASSAARSAGHCLPVRRSAGRGSDSQPERHEPAVQPSVGSDVQLRASPADVGHHDLAGKGRERAGCPAGDAQDRQGERYGVTGQVRGRSIYGGHRQVHVRR